MIEKLIDEMNHTFTYHYLLAFQNISHSLRTSCINKISKQGFVDNSL